MSSETEPKDHSHTAAAPSLALPAINLAGASETPSRADTLIEGDGSDRGSQDTNKKGQVAATGKAETLHPSGRPTSATKSEKNEVLQEKGDRLTNEEKRDPATATATEATDEKIVAAGEDDSDRYLTGFKLFLVFV
jgi:hypothetical protein